MNNKVLFDSVMKSVGKQVKKALREADEIQREKGNLVVTINSDDKRIETYLNNLNVRDIVVERTNKIVVYCTSDAVLMEVLEGLRDLGIFSDKRYETVSIKINRKGQSGIYDSLQESSEIEENLNDLDGVEVKEVIDDIDNANMDDENPNAQVSGDFVTDFIPSSDEENFSNHYDDMAAARWHAKYLIKHGLQVSFKEGRYSIKIHIHYDGQEQCKHFIKWLAYHQGFIENIGMQLSKNINDIMRKQLAKGSDELW